MSPSHRTSQAQLNLKRVIAWMASDATLSLPVISVIAVYPLAIGSIQVADPAFALPIDTHLYDLLAGFGAAAVLALGRQLRVRVQAWGRGVAINLLIWVLAGVAGTALQITVAKAVGPIPDIFVKSFGFGVLSLVGLMFSATALTLIYRELKQSTNSLAAKRFQLQRLRATLEDEVQAQRVSLRDEVAQRLASPIEQLISQVGALAAASGAEPGNLANASEDVANQLRQAIDQYVRPLSLEITSEISAIRPTLLSLVQLKKSIRRLSFKERITRLVPLGYIFNVPLTAALLAVFVLPSFAFILGSEGFWVAALPATVVSLTLIWLLGKSTQNLRTYFGFGLFESLFGAVLTASPFLAFGMLVLPNADLGALLYLAFQAFLVIALVSYGSLFIETAYLNLALAKQSNDEIRKLVAYLQNESQVNRRTMAQLVHGRIQASLQAASIKISQATTVSEVLVNEIKADLLKAMLDTQDTNYANLSARDQLAQMAQQWQGICELTINFEGGAEQQLSGNRVATAAVVEVIREGLNNAVKHGDADEADVVIRFVEPGHVEIAMRNSVYAQSAKSNEQIGGGYGSRMLDQITDSWSIEFVDGDAILSARVSLNQ